VASINVCVCFANSACILHHDNAPAHPALSVRVFLATKQITVMEHPTYSPDLAPSDFFLFPKIKETLKGKHFDDTDDIRSNTTVVLKNIPQNQFQNFLKSGLGAAICAWLPKGSTLKATTVVFSNEVCSTLPRRVCELYCPTTYNLQETYLLTYSMEQSPS